MGSCDTARWKRTRVSCDESIRKRARCWRRSTCQRECTYPGWNPMAPIDSFVEVRRAERSERSAARAKNGNHLDRHERIGQLWAESADRDDILSLRAGCFQYVLADRSLDPRRRLPKHTRSRQP